MKLRLPQTRRAWIASLLALALPALGAGWGLRKLRHKDHPLIGTRITLPVAPVVANALLVKDAAAATQALPALLAGSSSLKLPNSGVLVLEFFSLTCGVCRQTLPTVQHRFQGTDVEFIAVNIDETREEALQAVKDWGLVKPVAWDQSGELKSLFQVIGVPTMVVLSRSGRVAGWFGAWNPPDSILERALESARQG